MKEQQPAITGGNSSTTIHQRKGDEEADESCEKEACEKEHTFNQDIADPLQDQQEGEVLQRAPRVKIQTWFEVTVVIDGVEVGSGRGSNKTAAKHEASRHALQQLLPGVIFDEESGILKEIPGKRMNGSGWSTQRRPTTVTATTSCLDDLAPNLAKQLAIGHTNDDDEEEEDGSLVFRESKKRQKWRRDIYPGTSTTTSDDEDENSYLSSREASACSSLLHALVQTDDRLTEQPEYSYAVLTIPNSNQGGHNMKTKRNPGFSIESASSPFAKGTFQCTGMLKVRVDTKDRPESAIIDGSSRTAESYQLLRAVGTGSTKKDARQNVASKLLALLFPECDGIEQVKQAAEATREQYALMKQHAKRREKTFTAPHRFKDLAITSGDNKSSSFGFATASSEVPPIPASVELAMVSVIECSLHHNTTVGILSSDDSGSKRQLSRQCQLKEKVDNVLQLLNEHDDEGRSLPEELTVADVGRTVLRRANGEDLVWVDKLFGSSKPSKPSFVGLRPLSILNTDKGSASPAHRLWSSSTIILLLCRAIAPHEEPPLGCAVLTLGFSMQKGKVLRLAEIASEPHLPRERFIECLLSFADCMNCYLDTSLTLESSLLPVRLDSTGTILTSHLPSLKRTFHEPRNQKKMTRKLSRPLLEETLVEPALQSVKEEEGSCFEESDASQQNRKKDKTHDKPSKRSRFE